MDLTIKDIKEKYAGEFEYVEVYKANGTGSSYPNHFHTDNCHSTDDYTEDSIVGFYSLMDEAEYDKSIDANCEHVPFADYLGSSDAKILCIMLADE